MQIPINKIATVLGILTTFSVAGIWIYDYHSTLATKEEVHLLSLDTRISVVELVVMGYQSKGLNMLNDLERGRYDRANARLLTLESERVKATGLVND